jgi:hypothetical protein
VLLRIRTEFAQLARSFVERGVLPGLSCDGLRVARTGRGGSPSRSMVCSFLGPGERLRGKIASGRQELLLLDRTARIEIVTWAVRGAAMGGAASGVSISG